MSLSELLFLNCSVGNYYICAFNMSSTAEYRTITNLFGVSTSFVCLCIRDVCKTITKKLKNDFLKVPKGEDLREVMRLYKEKWGFPSCAGAIDGTHIPYKLPWKTALIT